MKCCLGTGRSEMLPWDWYDDGAVLWMRLKSYIYIHEISEGCVGIAVVAVSKYYYSNDILLILNRRQVDIFTTQFKNRF